MRVIAVDLDGTLLRSDATVSARTVAALRQATDAGARVVIVTARPPRFTAVVAAEAGIGGVAVCCNGAIRYDPLADWSEIVGPLPTEQARHAVDVVRDLLPGAGFALETGARVLVEPGYGYVSRRSMGRVAVPAVEELWRQAESCVKLLVWSAEGVTEPVLARLTAALAGLEVTYSGALGMVEISAAGVTKAGALAALCAEWAVEPEQVAAFGDMPNDLSVLRWAGLSVAVANAHPTVLAAAKRVTASNDEDGVAVVLEELFR